MFCFSNPIFNRRCSQRGRNNSLKRTQQVVVSSPPRRTYGSGHWFDRWAGRYALMPAEGDANMRCNRSLVLVGITCFFSSLQLRLFPILSSGGGQQGRCYFSGMSSYYAILSGCSPHHAAARCLSDYCADVTLDCVSVMGTGCWCCCQHTTHAIHEQWFSKVYFFVRSACVRVADNN